MAVWEETFKDHSYNTAIAAAAQENLISTKHNRDSHAPFNRLMVKNRDAVDIKIYLDGLDVAGKLFEIAAGETLLIEPGDGIKFTHVKQENLDGAVAEVADTILFRWAKAVRVAE